jgi:hypothetical protein
LEVNPISILTDKVFILYFKNKEDRQIISKLFKNYQSLVNNLYFEDPNIELKTRRQVDYVIILFLFIYRLLNGISKKILKKSKWREIRFYKDKIYLKKFSFITYNFNL